MKNIFCKSEKQGIPKEIILYQYPVRRESDLTGNNKIKHMDVFIDPKSFPLEVGNVIELVLSSSNNFAGGNLSLLVSELTELSDGASAITGHSPEAGTYFYLVIKDRDVN